MRTAPVLIGVLLAAAPAVAEEVSGAGLECAEPADADPATRKARAKEHYRRAEEIYALGEFELAIPEYHAAYCLQPVPSPVYNIAQAYERMVDYERAVYWFEEYIRLLPPQDKEIATVAHRVKTLKRLPARLKVSTDPPGAAITVEGPDGITRGKANSKEPLRIAAGRYTLRVEFPGYLPQSETIVAAIGQPYSFSYRLAPKTGRLAVTAHPADARIFVDGRIAGIGTFVDRVPIGGHSVVIEAEGRPSETREVTVEPDRTATLQVRMAPPRPRNGKIELTITSTLTGLSEGLILGDVFEKAPEVTGAFGIAGALLGFGTPYFLLPDYMPVGRTSLVIGATMIGAAEGWLISALFVDSTTDDAYAGVITVGGSLAFAGGALGLTDRWNVSEGDAAVINSGALWGTVSGGFLWGAFGSDDALAAPFPLIGLNIGILTGSLMSSRYEFSRGHVALIDLSGLAGVVSGTALASVAGVTDPASVSRFALGGMGVGLIGGALLTRNMDSEKTVRTVLDVAQDVRGDSVPIYGFALTW